MSEAKGYMTEERLAFQQQARDFTDEGSPAGGQPAGPGEGRYPARADDKMGEMGYFGITIPEEYGGLGLGLFRVLPDRGGTGARLDERRQHHCARQRLLHARSWRRRRAQAADRGDGARASTSGAFAMSEPRPART